MDKESNFYTIGYAVVLTVVVSVGLAFIATGLKARQDSNQRLATKMDILTAVGIENLAKANADEIFDQRIESVVLGPDRVPQEDGINALDIDMFKETRLPKDNQRYPLYVYKNEGETRYVIPVYGNGLWDRIWGYVALKEDMATVAGVTMDHRAETPGLGAEIKDNPKEYNDPFIGMNIYDQEGNYVGLSMKKGRLDDPAHQIDAITGATITADGVTEMLQEGVRAYLPYFDQLKSN